MFYGYNLTNMSILKSALYKGDHCNSLFIYDSWSKICPRYKIKFAKLSHMFYYGRLLLMIKDYKEPLSMIIITWQPQDTIPDRCVEEEAAERLSNRIFG